MAGDVIAVPALDALPFAIALREHGLLFSLFKTAHLLGVAMLVGPVLAFDLRVLGVNRTIPITWLAKHLLPLAVAALVLIIPSGLALFAANASSLMALSAFTWKMVLLLGGAVLAIVFHNGPYKQVAAWDSDTAAPASARVVALLSMLGWIAVLTLATRLGQG